MNAPRRLQLKEGREHLTVTDEFQSDKYPWCPAGFVPIKVTDPLAMDLLSEYADRRRVIDAEFTRDLNDALLAADQTRRGHCQCDACRDGTIHASDCAVHNAPAYPKGPCDCLPERRETQFDDESQRPRSGSVGDRQ